MTGESSELHSQERSSKTQVVEEEDPRLALVGRVVASEHFVKSPKLVKFLRYICGQVVSGSGSEINEQIVGIRVFGRAPGYDSNDDNIVRAHASRLRQKLDEYFRHEGRGEQLRIFIPRGCYIPEFSENVAEVSHMIVEPEASTNDVSEFPVTAPHPAGQMPSGNSTPKTRVTRQWLITLACCVACTLAAVFLTRQRVDAKPSAPEQPNHALWSALYKSDRLLVVPGDSSLDLYNNAVGRTMGISDYIAGRYRSEMATTQIMSSEELRLIANRRLTSIVDLRIVNRILRRPEANENVSVLYARDLRPPDLKQGNAILIGSKEANPWVQLFEDQLNFNIVPDQKTKVFTVVNLSPRPGEQPRYVSDPGSPGHLAYALVACVPNLSGKGYVLIVQGSAMAGTEAAADFALTNPELSELLHLRTTQTSAIPRFEILLQTSNLNGDAPSAKIVASRVY